jgi:hypothetical protein
MFLVHYLSLLVHRKRLFCLASLMFACLLSNQALAHPLTDGLEKLPASGVAWAYLKLGFTHILPLGYDHVLFVLGLYFLNPRLKTVVWQATAFTVAHSITLGLAMNGLINPPAYLIEPIIALSIAFVAIENLVTDQLKWWRTLVIFGFGLIHGCGFAGVLGELGMPSNHFFTALLSFNAGVELGQLAVILAAYLLVGRWFGQKIWYRQRIVFPVSALIAVIALYWTIERAFL